MTLVMFMNNNSISADDLWFLFSVRNNSCYADLFCVYLLVLTAIVCRIQFWELSHVVIWMNSLTFNIKHWCVQAWICKTHKQVVALCVYINCLYELFFVNNVESNMERMWTYKSLLCCYLHFYLFWNYYCSSPSTLMSLYFFLFLPIDLITSCIEVANKMLF